MNILSDESRLLIDKWETVEGVLRAKQQLEKELAALLFSVEDQLRAKTWWDDGWRFVKHSNSQVHITRREWIEGDEHIIMIGIESFSAEHLFGSESPPTPYVWVSGKRRVLVEGLCTVLRDRGDLPGEVERPTSGYVVRDTLRTCLPDELDTFLPEAVAQIVTFIESYAQLHALFTEQLNKYRGK